MNAAELADKLTSWIKDKVVSSGSEGVVIGLSGGIDSSVLAVLSKCAFPQDVLGIIMPCCGLEEDIKHAEMVATKFAIPTRKVVLDPVFEALLGVLPDSQGKSATSQLAEANLKPRLRMVTLYYFANKLNYLVVGSGNRSELAVGYFTKYGDGGVDILPLGGLLKGEVGELAQFLGIPNEIIDKPPSAGLWAGQTDEAELGLSYEELDRYLETGQAAAEIDRKIKSMMASSQHKRQTPEIPNFQV